MITPVDELVVVWVKLAIRVTDEPGFRVVPEATRLIESLLEGGGGGAKLVN